MGGVSEYSLAAFHDFLSFRRVGIEHKRNDSSNDRTLHNSARNLLLARLQAQVNGLSGEETDEPSNLGLEEQSMSLDLQRLLRQRRPSLNPDHFYNPQEGVEKYRYVGSKGVLGDRRYSNNTETSSRCTERIFIEALRENETAKEVWEQNDNLTISETATVSIHNIDDPNTNNGGVYDPYRPQLYTVSDKDPMYLLELPPAEKFRDSLQLDGKCSYTLRDIENSRKGKGNLTCLLGGSDGPDILAVACMSEILIYEFEETTNGVKTIPSLKIETRPDFTSNAHVRNSTWPFYPHTINSVKCHDDWFHGPILATCSDDGRILIWEKRSILKAMSHNKTNSSIRLPASHMAEVKASAWGIDFMTATSRSGDKHYIMCVSANTETMSLFYFDSSKQKFKYVESHKLSHNIPDIAFINYSVSNNDHLALVSCTTIQGELIVFRVSFHAIKMIKGNKEWYEVTFQPPEVIRRTELGGDGWTCKPIHSRFFKRVQSLRALTGDPNINESSEAANILCESKILAPERNSLLTSSLGIASYWQYFEPPMVSFIDNTFDSEMNIKTQGVNEEHQRIHEAYRLLCSQEDEISPIFKGLKDFFLTVSSEKSLYLYRADTLFCAAATSPAFTLEVPCDEETSWCDRISISLTIPELSCFIAITQIGLVTIMRLCEYKGVYGMRQEHLFPNALAMYETGSTQRTVIGLSSRNLSLSAAIPRFFLYLTYCDGLTLTYELSMKGSELNIVEI